MPVSVAHSAISENNTLMTAETGSMRSMVKRYGLGCCFKGVAVELNGATQVVVEAVARYGGGIIPIRDTSGLSGVNWSLYDVEIPLPAGYYIRVTTPAGTIAGTVKATALIQDNS